MGLYKSRDIVRVGDVVIDNCSVEFGLTREEAIDIVNEWKSNKHSTYTQDLVCSVMLKYKGDDMNEIVEPYEAWVSAGRPMDKVLVDKWYSKFTVKEGTLEDFFG